MASTPVQQFVGMLSALSQATRLRIIEVVAAGGEGGVAAGDIARELRCPASTLSFHLKELAQAGFLSPAPQGRFIRYSVQPAAFGALSGFVAGLPRGRGAAAATGTPTPRKRKPARRKGDSAGEAEEGQMSIFGD